MKWVKKLTAVCLTVLMAFGCSACGDQPDQTAKSLSIEQESTVYVWYEDARYTEYLNEVAKHFHEANEMVKIQPVLTGADNYLENIYEQSLRGGNAADVYLMHSDDLEKACLMGLAVENSTYASYYTQKKYGSAAIEAASYREKLYGYPVSFNTAFMVYNKRYVSAVEQFSQLTEFCNHYTVTEENQDIQQIITWDVSDMMLNFGFSSGSLQIGGSSGEDSASVQISREHLKNAMTEFVKLREDYGITRSEVTKESSIQRFAEGTLAYTITDLTGLREIDASGVDYGICRIPDLNEHLTTQSISETTMAMVNPYSSDLELAKAVAHTISYDYAGSLNEYSGLLSAKSVSYDKKHRENYKKIYWIYQNSSVKAQFIGADDFYARYEIMIHQIWDGTDVDTAIDTFVNALLKIQTSS